HETVHLRTLHLHYDVLTRAERGGVDLRDRRRRQRLALERTEHGFEGPQQILFDHAADDVERLWRHLIAALAEFDDERLGEDALARGDDLSELDVRRTQTVGGE